MKKNRLYLVIIGLIFLSSLNAFLAEANLTQTISACLGGTILRYQLSIGLFIVSLGFGSLSYPRVVNSLSNKNILILSTLGLGLISSLSPHLMHWMDQSLLITSSSPLHVLYYLPIVSIGLITGLDLPALIFLSHSLSSARDQVVLGLDYLGMFVACLIFPFLVLKFGIFQLTYFNLTLSLLSLGLLSFVPYEKSRQSHDQNKNHTIAPKPILWIGLLLSFCSLSYELILARWLVDFFENEVYAMTFTIGFFLLGLGLGSLTYKKREPVKQILAIESMLILGMLLLPLLFLVFANFWEIFLFYYISKKMFLFCLLLMVTWIGFWSGKELPYLMNLLDDKQEQQFSQLFFVNYIGALLATLCVSLFLIPRFGIYFSILTIVGLNLLTLFIIYFYFLRKKHIFLGLVLALSLLMTLIPKQQMRWQQLYLKTTYHKLTTDSLYPDSIFNWIKVSDTLDDIKRMSTPYQNIDLVRTELPYSGYAHNDLHLYINRQPQFSLANNDLYHDSFSHGAINLHGKIPKKVLILGGGDGFLANKLNQIKGIEEILLIELDPMMIDLAKNHNRISQANNSVFNNSKVQIVVGDASAWLKQNSKLFDGIFIDFPYPTNYETSRLYSLEFYSLAKQHLRKGGFLVFDAPFSFLLNASNQKRIEPAKVLFNTLKKAGFQSLFPYGSIEPFLYAEVDKRKIAFNYQTIENTISNSSFVNLLPIIELLNISSTHEFNSVYFPKKVVSW